MIINKQQYIDMIDDRDHLLKLMVEMMDHIGAEDFAAYYNNLKEPKMVINPIPVPANLKKRPLHVLDTVANNDLTITELADKLCISPITAHQHMAAARKALGVKTNICAVKKAVLQGYIAYN